MADRELLLRLYAGGIADSNSAWIDDLLENEEAMKYFRKHLSVSTYRKSSECERDDWGRIKIYVMRSSFVPTQQVVYRIRRMVQAEHSGPFVTWDEFSQHRKLRLFEQLQYHFSWDKKYNEQIYSQWEETASGYLHEVLSNARASGVKPSWVYDKNWPIMLKKWEKNDSDQIDKNDSLKRSSSMVEDGEIRIAKSQKKVEELSSERDPHTHALEAVTEASSNGENEQAPCVDHEIVQEVTSKEKDKVENFGKMIQEQINELNQLSATMVRQEQMNENTSETMMQFGKRVQIMMNMLNQVFGKQDCNGAGN